MHNLTKKETDKEKELERIVKRHIDNNDYFTAKNYVKSWGPLIEGYPVDVKLEEIEKLEEKAKKKMEA